MSLTVALVLVWLHIIADFVLQSDRIALAKSHDNEALAKHVAIYSLPFFWFGWQFVMANLAAHFVTDYITSRLTTKLWLANKRHWFFVTIGVDQGLHLSTLFVTYTWLV